MKILTHPVALALGISTLSLFFLIGPLISPSHSLIYHLSGPVLPLFISVGIDFCYLWLFTAALLLLAERYRRIWLPVWVGIILFLPWIVAKDAIMLEGWPIPRWAMVASFLLLLGAFIGLLSLRRAVLERTFLPLQRITSVLLGFAALGGLSILLQFLWCTWEVRNLNPPFTGNAQSISRPDGANRQRVIWILFDELSYQQVFERRFPGLSMPAFDALSGQSVLFTHVIPAGYWTERIIPSLFSGLPVDQISVSADGRLKSLRNPATGAWQPFVQHNTVFQDARSANYVTGVAGWFNPYCRLLPDVLDRCFWTFHTPDPRDPQSDPTWLAAVSSPIRFLNSYFRNLVGLGGTRVSEEVTDAELHIRDFQQIRDAADNLLADPTIDFVFLHISAPHPGGIFDRKRMIFATTGSSYLDNLVLADQYLAHVRLLLERQHQWDSSVVVVMGDHSWRTISFWKDDPRWTPEEEQASHGGKFDDRAGYIVKMPMQETALRVDTPFPAVKTRALLDGVINNQLKTGQDLKAWAEQQH